MLFRRFEEFFQIDTANAIQLVGVRVIDDETVEKGLVVRRFEEICQHNPFELSIFPFVVVVIGRLFVVVIVHAPFFRIRVDDARVLRFAEVVWAFGLGSIPFVEFSNVFCGYDILKS